MSNYLERLGVPWLFGQDQGAFCVLFPEAVRALEAGASDCARGGHVYGLWVLKDGHAAAVEFLIAAIRRAEVYRIIRRRRPRRREIEGLKTLIAELSVQPIWFAEWLRDEAYEWEILAELLDEAEGER